MARGLRLACEQCDFTATMAECTAFTLDASGAAVPIADGVPSRSAGYWSDALCGECRLPVRTERFYPAPDMHGESSPPQPVTCPTCGSELLTFEEAARELAEAAHSRAWIDWREESAGVDLIRSALAHIDGLRETVARYELTTSEALDALANDLRFTESMDGPSRSGTVMAYDDLRAHVENARDLHEAERMLQQELQVAEVRLSGLRLCVDDEAMLPGVPCPACQTGQLVHWPIWM